VALPRRASQRFIRAGHAVTGVRDQTGAEKRLRLGHEFVHSIVDDHSRLAYSERHPDAWAAMVTGFVERALAFFAVHGVEPKRLLSDNAWSYTHNRALRQLLAQHSIRHLLIEKRRRHRRTGRWSATNRRSSASGASARSTAHPSTAHGP
jgi:hypothetical protein